MASFSCHAFGVTKRFRLERIVRPLAVRVEPHLRPINSLSASDSIFQSVELLSNASVVLVPVDCSMQPQTSEYGSACVSEPQLAWPSESIEKYGEQPPTYCAC